MTTNNIKIYGKEISECGGDKDHRWISVKALMEAVGRRTSPSSVKAIADQIRDRSIVCHMLPIPTAGGHQDGPCISANDIFTILLILKPSKKITNNNPDALRMWKNAWRLVGDEFHGIQISGYIEDPIDGSL